MIDLNTLVRLNIQKLNPYKSAREQYLGQANIYLDANENPYKNGVNRYPDPQQKELKTLISKRNDIPVNQIVLGNGSDELLDLIMRVFCNPLIDNIIITPPTFGMYKVLANTHNVEVREAPLSANYNLDAGAVLELVDDNTKLIFLCSPNNPTGNLLNREAIKKLLCLHCIVVIDEAYIDFTEQESWSKLLSQYPNLIVTQTLSKAWAHAGIRVGMSFSSSEIALQIDKIRLPYNVNSLSQQKAIDLLMSPLQFHKDIKAIIDERSTLLDALNTIRVVQNVNPSTANFFLVQFNNGNKVYQFLASEGIITRDFSRAVGCENSLRIAIGTPAENRALIQSLKKIEQ